MSEKYFIPRQHFFHYLHYTVYCKTLTDNLESSSVETRLFRTAGQTSVSLLSGVMCVMQGLGDTRGRRRDVCHKCWWRVGEYLETCSRHRSGPAPLLMSLKCKIEIGMLTHCLQTWYNLECYQHGPMSKKDLAWSWRGLLSWTFQADMAQ